MKKLFFITISILLASTQVFANEEMPTIGDHFVLTDQDNKMFDSQKIKNKYRMIYFGFTRCVDVCPVGLSKMMKIHKSLEEKKDSVVPIFITIDPENDNPKVMKRFVSTYGKSLIGLTGPIEKIDQTLKKFRGYSKKLKNKNNAQYMMEHSDIIYVMDQKGKYVKHFTSSSKLRDMTSYMVNLIYNK